MHHHRHAFVCNNPRPAPARRTALALATLAVLALLPTMASAEAPAFRSPPILPAESPKDLVALPATAAKSLAKIAAVDSATRGGGNQYSEGSLDLARGDGREVGYTLPIRYTEGQIYNPATGKFDPVRLRSYRDEFTAPTIRVRPGQTVRVSLSNELPEHPDCAVGKPTNTPHCFNTTNLHSHGLWVSPMGNSDNVLLSLEPGVAFQYEYNIPVDHPAGTFWYHPHKHGSTAMQVASGMAGVLLVEGHRAPTQTSNGDLDTLLRPVVAGDPEDAGTVMLIQQIPYACFDDEGNIETDANGRWICKDGQTGVVENFGAQFGPGVWGPSGRYTSINGQVRPRIGAEAGRLYRWRLVQAGIREAVRLRIRKVDGDGGLRALVKSDAEASAEVSALCNGVDVTQFEVAADGLTRGQAFAKITNPLEPGYRSDVLFVLPERGSYCVYDDSSGTVDPVTADTDNPKVLGLIVATGSARVDDQQAFVQKQLIKAAQRYPDAVRDVVVKDLEDELKLTKFVPHASITAAELEASNLSPIPITFNIQIPPTGQSWPIQFMINNAPYQGDRIDHTLILGTTQAWQLQSDFVNHPFHIHVNPFQIASIKDRKTGTDISATDIEYAGMVGTWKDTLLVRSDVSIEVHTRYQRYIGDFVLHCHILDHEDQGMMQNVRIVLPNGKGGAAHAGH